MILFNMILLVLSILFSMWIWNKFIHSTWIDQQKFRLYALRDQLAILVVNGYIEEKDARFQFLLKHINSSIMFYSNDFQIVRFIKIVITSESREKEKKEFNKMVNSIKSDPILHEIQAHVFMEMLRAFRRELIPLRVLSIVVRYVILPIVKILFSVSVVKEPEYKRIRKYTPQYSTAKSYERNFIRPALA